MVTQYRNFFIRYDDLSNTITARIYVEETGGMAFAMFTSPNEEELDRLVRLWIDTTLAEDRHFVRQHRRAARDSKLNSLQAWLS